MSPSSPTSSILRTTSDHFNKLKRSEIIYRMCMSQQKFIVYKSFNRKSTAVRCNLKFIQINTADWFTLVYLALNSLSLSLSLSLSSPPPPPPPPTHTYSSQNKFSFFYTLLQQLVHSRLESIFTRHGATSLSPPLLCPRPADLYSGGGGALSLAQFMDRSGAIVTLPHDHRVRQRCVLVQYKSD